MIDYRLEQAEKEHNEAVAADEAAQAARLSIERKIPVSEALSSVREYNAQYQEACREACEREGIDDNADIYMNGPDITPKRELSQSEERRANAIRKQILNGDHD